MGSYDRNFLTDEPKKQRVDTYDTVYQTLHLARDFEDEQR